MLEHTIYPHFTVLQISHLQYKFNLYFNLKQIEGF